MVHGSRYTKPVKLFHGVSFKKRITESGMAPLYIFMEYKLVSLQRDNTGYNN